LSLIYPAPGQVHCVPLIRAPERKPEETEPDFKARLDAFEGSKLKAVRVKVRLLKRGQFLELTRFHDASVAELEKAQLDKDRAAMWEAEDAVIESRRRFILASCAGVEGMTADGHDLTDAGMDPALRADLLEPFQAQVWLACIRGQTPEPDQRD
jgi:hypothetical protein